MKKKIKMIISYNYIIKAVFKLYCLTLTLNQNLTITIQ